MKPPKMPPNRGRILLAIDNKTELRFWIRVFELEGQIAEVQMQFNAQTQSTKDSKWACIPIISHYVAGDLTWFYVLIVELDFLGVCGGTGIIYYADKDNCQAVAQARDKFADNIMEHLRNRAAAGDISEIAFIGPGEQQ